MLKQKISLSNLLRKIGPARLLSLSFILVILTGTFFLSLPISNKQAPLSFLDNLFMATTSTCVTGLVVVPVVEQYTFFGQFVLLVLIQVGGLGLMSFIALFIVFLRNKLHHNEKIMMQDALNKLDLQNIPSFLRSLFMYTFLFESIGACILMFVFIPKYGWGQGMFNAIFLAISAFCNAGIDNMYTNSLMSYSQHVVVNLTIACLIITGGLGFAVWINIKEEVRRFCKDKYPIAFFFEKLKIHTKIVLFMTFTLIVSGMVLILILEWNNPNTLGSYAIADRFLIAFFNSVTLRTAGFATLNYGLLNRGLLAIMCVFMFIGGSSGGTAGGIKTSTIFIILTSLFKQLRGYNHVHTCKKEISMEQFRKAFAIFFIYMMIIFIAIVILLQSETLPTMTVLFEAFSAIGTVGLSVGITSLLTSIGKIVIILLMFIGRVGPITITLSIIKNARNRKVNALEYPQAELLIG